MVRLFRVFGLNRAFEGSEIILPFVIQTTPKYSFCGLTDGMIISGNMFQIRVITNFRAYLGLVTNDVIISGSPF